MNDAQIRAIVQQEIARSAQANRFNLTNTTRHQHTKNDVAPISQNDITPGNCVVGSPITFAHTGIYKIGVNFNPTSVFVTGVLFKSTNKYMVVGSAQFGPGFYLQPDTGSSVKPGGPRQIVVQSATYCGVDATSNFHTLVTQGAWIVDVSGFPTDSDIYARMRVIGYTNKYIEVEVTTLASGYELDLSFTIT